MDALAHLIEGRTVIIIAHRLSTTEMADTVAVLESGEIAEIGPARELRTQGDYYRRLYALYAAEFPGRPMLLPGCHAPVV